MKRSQKGNTKDKKPAKMLRSFRRVVCLILVLQMLVLLFSDTQISLAGEMQNEVLNTTEDTQGELPEETDSQGEEIPEETDSQEEEIPEGTDSQEEEVPEGTDSQEEEVPEGTDSQEEEVPEGTDSQEEEIPEESGSREEEVSEEAGEQEEGASEEAEQPEEETDGEEETENPAEDIRILEYAEELTRTVYWADDGNARGIRPAADEAAPVLTFRKSTDGTEDGTFTALSQENLQEVCLEEMPAAGITEDGDSFTVSYAGTSLPASIEETDEEGRTAVWQIEWEFSFPELEGYELTEVTEEDLEQGLYDFADRGAGWYYVLIEEEPETETGVRVDAWSEDLEQEIYWVELPDSDGSRPDSEDFPDVELTFSLEEASSQGTEETEEEPGQVLAEDNMDQVGLSELPSAEAEETQTVSDQIMALAEAETEEADTGEGTAVSYTVRQYTVKISGDSLPSAVTETGADGEERSYTVSWDMELPRTEGYALLEITDDMLEEEPDTYFYALQSGAGTYYVANGVTELRAVQRSGIMIDITEQDGTVSQHIFWVDNGNEGGIRPDTNVYKDSVIIQYYVSDEQLDEGDLEADGLLWTTLSDETLSAVGLEEMPEADITENGAEWTYSLADLPSQLTRTDEMGVESTQYVYWRVVAPEQDSYLLTEVTEENADEEGVSEGWYYVAETDFEFRVDIRWGDQGTAKGLRDQNLEKFYLKTYVNGELQEETQLKELDGDTLNTVYDQDGDGTDSANKGTVTITGLPMYTLSGEPITYTVGTAETDGEPDRLTPEGIEGIDDGDYFSIRYDNTDSALGGSTTDEILDGGSLIMILTGETTYSATKVWLDEANSGERPEVTFYLWRYRAGESYTTAAQVTDENGQNITMTVSAGSADTFTIEFKDSEGNLITLDKYDAEGYRYIYVVREVIDGSGYEQVFGSVGEDGEVSDFILVPDGDSNELIKDEDGRTGTNEFVYNGGTISNRLTDTVETTVVKDWKAEAFQAHFEDVTIELSLESRPVAADGEKEQEWEATGTTVTMDDFYAEQLTDSETLQVPRYGSHGEELEYRWVESAVYQNGEEITLSEESEGVYTFTLTQNGEEVTYRSTTKKDPETGAVIVTNQISDTITYEVEKIWEDEDGNDISGEMAGTEVTFAIYRSVSGEEPDYEEPYCTFTMDGEPDEEETTLTTSDGLEISMQEAEAWHASVTGLPEYNEEGLLYEYYLLEISSEDQAFVPTYETERTEDGGYLTTVTNAPGTGHYIIVQKYWTDSSDVTHREDVTIGVYARDTGKLVEEVTLSGANGGSWNAWVGIGAYEPEEVFIVETEMGGHATEYLTESDGTPVPTTEDGKMNEEAIHQFSASNHRYEASYGVEKLEAVGSPTLYTVTNRRLGNVNITVTKEWVDGDGEQRKAIVEELERLKEAAEENSDISVPKLVLYLDFSPAAGSETYKMTHSADAGTADEVNIGYISTYLSNQADGSGSDGKTVLELDLDTEASTYTYYFNNLPKYDLNGSTVSYEVRESWGIEQDGEYVELTDEELEKKYPKLYELYKEYTTSMTTSYDVTGELHTSDQQMVEITNQLTGSKTVQWTKQWNDDYTYQNKERPDLYIDLYQLVHNSSDADDVSLQLYQRNYLWTQDDDETTTRWTADFGDLPMYDDYGYEIIYYAVEQTMIAADQLGYQTVGYSINEGSTVTDLGSSMEPTEDAKTFGYVYEMEESGAYALKEGGTFTNSIAGETTVTVRKLWENLPDQYPSEDLPTVTFYLDRYVSDGNGSTIEAQNVASLTISEENWEAILSGSIYTFTFEHEGENELNIAGDGTVTVIPKDSSAEKLPKFDENGRLYQYVLREEVQLDDSADGIEVGQVFNDPGIVNFTATNTYASETGSLSFQKYLKLADQNTYPAVYFRISRTYTTNTGTTSDVEYIRVSPDEEDPYHWMKDDEGDEYLVWSSEEVEKTAGNSTDSSWLQGIFTLDGLERYAPNGSEYVYTIEEVTGYLNGYDTWAVDQNVTEEGIDDIIEMDQETSVTDLKPLVSSEESGGEEEALTVSATFINQPSTNPETQILTGTKVWDDARDVFDKRPDEFNIAVTVYREADSQPGQDNAIKKTELTANTDYSIEWKKTDEEHWTYTITGIVNGELALYAPNGMEWEYTVEETHIDSYTAVKDTASENGNPTVDESSGSLVQSMTDLENSIMTSESFSKYWVDSDGDEITEDYLGYELEVTFTLQVREISDAGNTKWQDAETYFEGALSDEVFSDLFNGYSFTQTLTGRLGDDLWNTGDSFDDLPGWIVKSSSAAGGDVTTLEYRVVESCITVTGTNYKQEITVENSEDGETYTYSFADGLFGAYYGEKEESHQSEDNTQYNKLETTDLTITKVWAGDKNNQYGTRPEAGENSAYDWQVSFVIQRSSDGGTVWEPVMVSEEGGTPVPLIVELYGDNADGSVSRTVSGLPESGLSEDGEGTVNYQYRAVELNPLLESDEEIGYTDENLEDYMVEESGTYADTYTASYDYSIPNATTVTNTMVTTNIYAEKNWESNGGNTESVSLTLQYLSGYGEDGEEIWTDVSPEETVTLDGQAEAESADKDYWEYEAWKAKWTNLPEVLPGSVQDEYGKTQYRVTESALAGYETDYEYGETTDEAGDTTIITNKKVTSLTVEKIWAVADESEIQEVTVGLWRTTGTPGDENKEEVLASDGAQMTLTLNSQNNWTDTFEGLPEYGGSESGAKKYVYYAREIRIGTGDGAVQIEDVKSDSQYAGDWKIVHVQDTQNKKTTIYNIGRTDLTVTKTWKDDGNAYGTRPETLELKIYRSTEGGEEEEVTADILEADGTVLVWTGTDTDVWTYTYSGLPLTDDEGNLYTYRVEEIIPDGYEADTDGYDFTNTLSGTVDIPVTKVWEDNNNSNGKRPEEIELILYANGVEVQRVKVGADTGTLEALWNRATSGTDNTWEYAFSGLPRYDENGAEIAYTVQEVVPDGYRVDYGKGDNTITNVKRGSGSTGSDDSSDEENAVMAVSAAVPTGSVKTGDSARILLWTAAAVLSAAVLTVIGVYAYRRRKK